MKKKFNHLVLKQYLFWVLFLFFHLSLSGQSWVRSYGNELASDIVEAKNSDLLFTVFDEKVVRIDSDGDQVWSVDLPKSLNATLKTYARIAPTQDDHFIIANVASEINQDTTNTLFLTKLDNAGQSIFAKNISIDSLLAVNQLVVFENGNLVLAGWTQHGNQTHSFVLYLNAAGDLISFTEYDWLLIDDLLETDNSLLILGSSPFPSTEYNVHLLNTTLEGVYNWGREIGKSGVIEFANSMLATEDGYLLLYNERDTEMPLIFGDNSHLVKVDFEGNIQWNQQIDANLYDAFNAGQSILERPDGGYYVLLSDWIVDGRIIQLDENGISLNQDIILPNRMGGQSFLQSNTGHFIISGLGIDGQATVAKSNLTGQFFAQTISGNLFQDNDLSCFQETTETGLANWIVSIKDTDQGINYFATTDSLGNYEIALMEGTTYELTVLLPSAIWQVCPELETQIVQIDTASEIVHFPIQPVFLCPLLDVNLTTPFLRSGVENIYSIQYKNEGTAPASNVHISLNLDEHLRLIGNPPPFLQEDQELVFPIKDLAVGEAGHFEVKVQLDEAATIGQAHCSTAKIYPDTFCLPNVDWDGSSITLDGECLGDSVRFRIQNVGGGDMSNGAEQFVIIVEEIVLFTGDYELEAGAFVDVTIPAQSATYRMQTNQSPGHPGNSMPSVTVEGCPDFGTFGFVNWYALDDADKFIDIDCTESSDDVFKAIDLKSSPVGYGLEHQILPATKLEYLIHFQNTENQILDRIVVTDTLSKHLDYKSLVINAASHPYQWEVTGEGVLKVVFEDIALPSSQEDALGSIAFLKFNINPKNQVPLGTIIENFATISTYDKDFQTPTLTHRIDTNFIQKEISSPLKTVSNQLVINQPNPFKEQTVFDLPQFYEQLELMVWDQLGRQVRRQEVSGRQLVMARNNLSNGVYFYNLHGNGSLLGAGILLIQSE